MAYELAIKAPGPVNHNTLAAALRAALPACDGHVYSRGTVRVIFPARPPTEAERALAEQIVASHDPTALTAEQQERADDAAAEASFRPLARQAKQEFATTYAALTTGWNDLDGAGKQAALRAGLVIALRLLRWLVARQRGI